MSKQCPNCGKELEEAEKICPNCNFEFEAEKISEQLDIENSEKNTNKEGTTFKSNGVNENIEWSELKDMSLGHVMNMFNDQAPESVIKIDPSQKSKQTNEKEPETAATVAEKNLQGTDKPEEVNSDVEVRDIQSDVENPMIEDEVSPLYQYIKEHKTASTDEAEVDITNEGQQVVEEITAVEQNSADVEIEAVEFIEDQENLSDCNELEGEALVTSDVVAENDTESTESEEVIKDQIDPIDAKEPTILSKSKKPEEIEMDAVPIFYKEPEEPTDKELANTMDQASTNNRSQATKNNKKRYLVAASVLIVATGGWFAYEQVQKNAAADKKAQTEQLTKQKELATATEEALANYFTDDSQVYIKPGMVGVSTATIKKNLDQLKNHENYKKLKTKYTDLVSKQTKIAKVNALFAQPVINGNTLSDVAISADKKIDLKKIDEQDGLDKLINQGIAEATNQYNQLQKAKEAVALIYKENKITDNLTLATYDSAKAEVDKVKSALLRKPLTDSLTEANKFLVGEQQQAETQVADNSTSGSQETDAAVNTPAQTTQNNSEGFTPPNSSGVYTDPVYTVNPNDVADLSNPAWAWSAGVKEKVIATCIERGYIVEGGYTLEPVRIINGEGYYNLYGTSNQSTLLAGFSENDFPVYLVTINAKTGWFKGNASRNAGG